MFEQTSSPRATRSLLASVPQAQEHRSDILIIGGGAAGLSAALRVADRADVSILMRTPLLESNSARAQGGVAAVVDPHDQLPSHIEDTLIAGAGLCDEAAVRLLVESAPALMYELAELGVPFAHEGDEFSLGLEGGHSHRRILHVGDATGWALTSTLATHVRKHPRIRLLEGFQAVDLLEAEGRITGVLALDPLGDWHRLSAGATILATGGAGALYGLTSNGPAALGEGIAMAYRAGAAIADMEFIQFHPTVMRTRSGEGFLISEAVRGEGAILLDANGWRFMPDYDPRAELAPRDIVARGIYEAMQRTQSEHVFLDMRHLLAETLEHHFPTITARCRAEGYDPATTLIPIAPASHYLMGGICTNLQGATSLAGLYAAGECTCTGVHGANRLASNSLLECLVFGRQAAESALAFAQNHPIIEGAWPIEKAGDLTNTPVRDQDDWREQLSAQMRENVGLIRDEAGLVIAQEWLEYMAHFRHIQLSEAITAANANLVARLVVAGALAREESRGGHFRSDYPETNNILQCHIVHERGHAPYRVDTAANACELLPELY